MERWLNVGSRSKDAVCIENLSDVGKVSLFVTGGAGSTSIWLTPEEAMKVALTLIEAVTEEEADVAGKR